MAKSSRICIWNLPLKLSEEQLKEITRKFGQATDCRILKKMDVSRGFGFVGFAKEEDAEKMIQEMNGKYFQGRKLELSFSDLKPSQ